MSTRAKILFTAAAVLTAAAAALLALRSGSPSDSSLPASLDVPEAPPLSPKNELAGFQLEQGFEIQLVAAEPLVIDPVHLAYDERGRLWVTEMRGYMQSVDGSGEQDPNGVIAVLTDTDGDGRMDERTEFASGLVLPRGALPMEGGALCVLPPELVFLSDEDGDGVHDRREVILGGLNEGIETVEYAINSPTMGLDGWVQFANWDRRVRRSIGEDGEPRWEVEQIIGSGQWGLGVDALGRFYRNTNGKPLFIDVSPAHYGARNRHPKFFPGFMSSVEASNEVFPSRVTPGVNRGYQEGVLREDWTLREFSSACAPTALIGSALGAEAEGNAFVAEPAGHLIKRYRIEEIPGRTSLKATSVHGELDFLTSTDERFRPTAMISGPDGALIIADMYRGVIQHHSYMTGFLRKQVKDRGLDAPAGLGRIWRVVQAGTDPRSAAHGAELDVKGLMELVADLGHKSPWVRRQAQRLITEDFDGEASVVEALRAGAAGAELAMERFHCLWTLHGIGHADEPTLRAALQAKEPFVRAAAAEIAGPLLALEGSSLFEPLAELCLAERDPRARLHALLAIGDAGSERLHDVYLARLTASALSPFERGAIISGLPFEERAFVDLLARTDEWKRQVGGRPEVLQSLGECVEREGLAENVARLVELALDPPAAWWSEPLLAGLAKRRPKGPGGEPQPFPLPAEPAGFDSDAAAASPDSISARVARQFTWPGHGGTDDPAGPRPLSPAEQIRYEQGKAVFRSRCASCHQEHGGGERGKAPTLRGTPYVLGDEEALVGILARGLKGPIEVDGETWNQEMPRFEGNDAELAAVATYVRRSWGNGADPVGIDVVRRVRESAGTSSER